MEQSYLDMLFLIHAYHDKKGGYPGEAKLSDRSEYLSAWTAATRATWTTKPSDRSEYASDAL
jgi:hypothetical protein